MENIHRIHQMMGVINEDEKTTKIQKIIDKMGLSTTIKLMGGIDGFKEMTKDILHSHEEKILFIKNHIQKLLEDWEVENVSVRDLDASPIPYGIPDEKQKITHFGPEHVTIKTHEGENYNKQYENLDDNTINEIYIYLVKYFYAAF